MSITLIKLHRRERKKENKPEIKRNVKRSKKTVTPKGIENNEEDE